MFILHYQLPRVLVLLVGPLLLGGPHAEAFGPCNTTCSGNMCTVSAMATTPMDCLPGDILCGTTTMVFNMQNANCTLGTMSGTAMATPIGAGPASCVFTFRPLCRRLTNTCQVPGFAGPAICTVNNADGLPVELLDFKVTSVPSSPAPIPQAKPRS